MPAPRWLARFNRVGTNRTLGQVAPFLPLFGVIVHRGRRSGREHRTPVNVFGRPGGWRIALTYGRESDWVRNVLAAGGAELITLGRRRPLVTPRLVRDDGRAGIPIPVRWLLAALRVSDFLDLDEP